MKRNGRKYRRLYAEWLRNRANRTKPVASKTQKKRPLRRCRSARNSR